VTRRPDVLVIVADCVGERELVRGITENPTLPNLARLTRNSLTYTRAVSPSNWTLPSHASMFTGLFPWEHDVVSDGSIVPAEVPTFAEMARAEGYKTASFSGNPYVSDSTGLARGFDAAFWGRFGECLYRGFPIVSHPRGRAPPQANLPLPRGAALRDQPGLFQTLRRWVTASFPAIPDLIAELLAMTGKGACQELPLVSPWIEDYLSRWLSAYSCKQPVLCFVNLLDAHEPYFGLSKRGSSITNRLSTWSALRTGFRTPQSGCGLPGKEVREALKDLYRRAIRIIDERVGRILASFSNSRDIDNTLIVFTGDHGQAFGESGLMYHGFGTDDVLFRVPLVVVPPGKPSQTSVVRQWTSTTKLASVIRRVVSHHTSPDRDCHDIACSELRGEDTVWALGSTLPKGQARIPPARTKEGTGFFRLVGYWNDCKIVVDPVNATTQLFTANFDAFAVGDTVSSSSQELTGAPTNTPSIRAWARANSSNEDHQVVSRLARWGYV
jgi:arylsulfatase A-like enzyme